MESAAVDVVASHPVLHVGQGAGQVETEGAPFLADRLVEPPQPPAERLHEPGEVVRQTARGGVLSRQRLGEQDGGVADLAQCDHDRDREVGRSPDHALRLGAEASGSAAADGDLGEADVAVGAGEPPGGQVGDEAVGERRLPPRERAPRARAEVPARRGGTARTEGRGCRQVGGNGYRLGDTAGRMECTSRTT